jgi:Uma2 family endonuclease
MTTEISKKKLYTVEEFMNLLDDDKAYELLGGELVEIPGPNVQHGLIISKLFLSLGSFLAANSSGKVLTNLAFELNPKSASIPDLAYVSTERLPGIDSSKAFPGAPDLVIEVMSPNDKWSAVSAKVQLYQHAGAKLVWVIDPFDRGVTVYRLDHPRRLLLLDDELNGEDVIPGFKLPVRTLFE